jgi:hypothetical protein
MHVQANIVNSMAKVINMNTFTVTAGCKNNSELRTTRTNTTLKTLKRPFDESETGLSRSNSWRLMMMIFTVKKCKPNTTIGISGRSAVDNLHSSVSDTFTASSVISKPVTNNPVKDCVQRTFPGYWNKEKRLHGLQNEWLMIQKATFCCKVCSEAGTVSTHKMHRSLSCQGNNKTALCKVSVTITEKQRQRIKEQNLATKYCCITGMCHNTHKITGRKVPEIKHGDTYQSCITGIPKQADKGRFNYRFKQVQLGNCAS